MPSNSYSEGCRAGTRRGGYIAVITTLRSGSCTYQHKQASGLGINKYSFVRIKCNYVHVQPLKKCIVELVPSVYSMKHIPLPGSRKGGGVALLYKSTLSFCLLGSSTTGTCTNFEHMDCVLNTGEMTVHLAVL